jgi:hypothetical protein
MKRRTLSLAFVGVLGLGAFALRRRAKFATAI